MVMVSHCLSGGSFSLAEAVAGQGENPPSSHWSIKVVTFFLLVMQGTSLPAWGFQKAMSDSA